MSEDFGWACGRVLRWHEPSAALDDGPPYNLDIFDSELGIWLTLAHVDLEDDAMAQGIPVLRGPYVVDYTDIPHDGDKKTLWTPQVGDVLLRLFPDMATVVQWDKNAVLSIYQENQAGIALATPGNIGLRFAYPNFGTLDSIADALSGQSYDPVNGNPTSVGATVFHTTDPVVIKMWNPTADPTQGHVELYALVARALAP